MMQGRLYVRAVESLNCGRDAIREASLSRWLDAGESPIGRFSDDRVTGPGKLLQNLDGLRL